MKNMSFPIAVVIAILGCAMAVNAYITSSSMRQSLEEERYKRMVAEEHLQNTKSDMDKIRADLSSAQQTLSSIQQLVNKGKDKNSELNSELDQVKKERNALKDQLDKIQATTVVAPTAPSN